MSVKNDGLSFRHAWIMLHLRLGWTLYCDGGRAHLAKRGRENKKVRLQSIESLWPYIEADDLNLRPVDTTGWTEFRLSQVGEIYASELLEALD